MSEGIVRDGAPALGAVSSNEGEAVLIDTTSAPPEPRRDDFVHQEPAVITAPHVQHQQPVVPEKPVIQQTPVVDVVPAQPASQPDTQRGGTVAAAKEAHLDPDAHVLPLGDDVHPEAQKQAIDHAPTDLVESQVEKAKADERHEKGLPPKGTVVEGFEDDRLWALVRRFNTQVTHTLSPASHLPPGEPDLRPTGLPKVPFSSDILKSNLERCYSTSGVYGIYAARELMRLMSWTPEERHRTASFCAAYFIAAWYSQVIPLIMLLLIVLTVSPRSRVILFPPVKPPPGIPPSATDPTNKRGDESMLAGVGHPVVHRSKAEQVEEQAWEFTNTIQRFGVRVVMGGHTGKNQGNGEVGRKAGREEVDDSTDTEDEKEYHQRGAAVVTDASDYAERDEKGKELSDKQRKKLKAKEAKQKRDQMVGDMARGLQEGLGQFADFMEMMHYALSPPPRTVYPRTFAKEKIAAAIFLPIAVVFAIVPAHIWAKVTSFGVGFAFFGQPLAKRGMEEFVRRVPNWRDYLVYLDVRNSLLSKVPTDAQMTLHILRDREAQFDPMIPAPPPPTAKEVKEEMSKGGIGSGDNEQDLLEAGASDGELKDGAKPSTKLTAKAGNKILGGLRLAARKAATFRGDVTVDGARAKVGNKIDRVFYQSKAKDFGTLDSFPAKLHGKSGHLELFHEPGSISTLSFVPIRTLNDKPIFKVPIDDIVEIKKKGIFIGRAVLGWAASVNLEGMGLELRMKNPVERATEEFGQGDDPHEETHEGDYWAFSHVARRDQLFARLLGISHNKWETL